jgi:nitrite reductase/ring-hydroxylating ferredoxin subunit
MNSSLSQRRVFLMKLLCCIIMILDNTWIISPSMIVVSAWWCGNTYQPGISLSRRTIRTRTTIIEMKRGRGQLGKEIDIDDDSSTNKGLGSKGNGMISGSSTSNSRSGPVINWIPIAVSLKELPTEENKVKIIDTNLPTMKNGQTNPTGAVSVMKYHQITYCFAINCPSCQIPLTKATMYPPADDNQEEGGKKQTLSSSPRLVCDFCKTTYNIQTGEKCTQSAVEKPGLFGGIAKSLFASQASGNLKTFKLGERNGKLLIALD